MYNADPNYNDPYAQYGQPPQQPPASPFQPAPSAPPIYSSAPGSTYTNFQGQQGVVPAAAPVNADAPALKEIWNSVGQDPQRFVQAIIQRSGLHGRQADPTAINTILRSLQAVGVNASLDTRSDSLHKGLMLNGQFVKLLDGNDNWIYQPGGGAGGEGGTNYAVDPSFLAPYTEQFAAPADAALPQFQSPGAFKLPTVDELQKDPSYLWEEGRIRDSVQNSASAAGTLNSSGTLDRIMGATSDFARTNYNNYVNRDLGIWNADWTHALDAYGAQTGRATNAYQRAMQEFDQRKTQFFQNQDRPYDKIMAGVNLGARAAMA